MRIRTTTLSALTFLAACSVSDGRDGVSTLVVVTPEATGTNCTTGGQRIDVGPDDGAGGGIANNGMLEPGEIASTEFVCNGDDGMDGDDGTDGMTSLVTVNEACGEFECPEGGVSIDSGLDTDGDGELDSSEITSSALVCGGTLPPPEVLGGGFTTTDDWTVTGAASIDTSATGYEDPGEAVINTTAACAGDTVSQALSFPPECASQPLAVHLAARMKDIDPIGFPTATLEYAGVYQKGREVLQDTSYVEDTLCFGVGAYGGDRSIGLSHSERPGAGCQTLASIAYDNVTIIPARSICPLAGEVLNGSFDDGTKGWRVEQTGGTFEAVIDDGSVVGRLSIPAVNCNSVSLTNEASVPAAADVPNPALEFRWRSVGLTNLPPPDNFAALFEALVYNGPSRFGELVGGFPSFVVTDPPGYQTERICLDSRASGIVVNVLVELRHGGTCPNTQAAEVFVDDFRIVNDPSCS